jgi:hypothetical protein
LIHRILSTAYLSLSGLSSFSTGGGCNSPYVTVFALSFLSLFLRSFYPFSRFLSSAFACLAVSFHRASRCETRTRIDSWLVFPFSLPLSRPPRQGHSFVPRSRVLSLVEGTPTLSLSLSTHAHAIACALSHSLVRSSIACVVPCRRPTPDTALSFELVALEC